MQLDQQTNAFRGEKSSQSNGKQKTIKLFDQFVDVRDVLHWRSVCLSVMFSTGCQSHSASSTSSAYSSFFHFAELLQSTCAIAAPGLIPPHPDYGYDHWRGLISVCGG